MKEAEGGAASGWSGLRVERPQGGAGPALRDLTAAGLPCLFFQVLYQQFKFFLNLYFLVVALSQFVPSLAIGFLYTYWAPLVSMC